MDRKTGMFSYHLLAAAVLSLGLSACGGGSSESGNSAGGGDVGGGDGGSGGGGEELAPLLRSASAPSGGHRWAEFCAGQADSALLPQDPRELIVDGANDGRAVVFNVDWRSCETNDPLRPTTCGDYRSLYAKGELIGRGQGEVGTAHMFSGDTSDYADFTDPTTYSSSGSLFTISAEAYNRLWLNWTGYLLAPALPARPDNFDELVAERYGSPLPEERNPYPLAGEDPNASNGGSGQLPIGFTQLREPDGSWTGQIGVKLCSFCHDGQISGEPVYGGAGTIGDFTVAFRDFAAAGLSPTFGLLGGPITIAANRGTGAIDQFQIGFLVFNGGNIEEFTNDKILFSQAIGNIKSPPWWNMGHRVQKFHGSVLPMDASRIDMAAYYPLLINDDPAGWVDEASYPFQIWAESITAPKYPGAIDPQLAEQGAILFHAKNLWAANLNNPVPEPEQLGNGSCASCHGVYSPRYAEDDSFLADPDMMGIAANLVDIEVIRTDPVYAQAQQSLRNADGSPNIGIDYNPFLTCGVGDFGDTPNNTPVLLAPPLFGIWASAPYLHNASVPNLWGVLDPDSERPNIWLRQSAPAPEGMEGRVVMGFDTDFDRAYDQEKLGWKYTELDCLSGFPATQPLLNCNPIDEDGGSLQDIFGAIYERIALLWNLPIDELANIPLTDQQIENRKVYNTNIYSQGNEGHDFTAVLTDAERRAIIEYLKTL